MSWLEYQRTLRDVLLADDPSPAEFLSLGEGTKAWRAYRRMVRSRFYQTIDHAFERLIGAIGVETFHALIDRFLARDPPRSPYLRDLPGEFLQFVERTDPSETGALPPYALDLMRYEWRELDTAYSHQEVLPADVVPLDMHRRAALSPAHRLLELEYRVHEMGVDGGEAPVKSPVWLCLYRDRTTHEVETLELTRVAARIVAEIARRPAPLAEIARDAAEAEGLRVDAAFVETLSALLTDLTERGVLLGSLA